MSALSPWQLVWGKLFGSTLFAWYGTALCILLYLVASNTAWSDRLPIALFVVLAGLMVQAATMLLCLSSMPRNLKQGRVQSFSYVLLISLVCLPWLFGAMVDLHDDVQWYSWMLPKTLFVNLSVGIFLMWALAGLYRLMRQELQMRQGFAVWLGFELCVIIYLNNFMLQQSWTDVNSRQHIGFFPLAMFQAAAFTYLMLFLEGASPIDAKQALRAMRQGRYTTLMQWIPCWLLSLFLAAIFFIASAWTMHDSKLLFFLFGVLLFVVRDVAILLWVRFSPDQKPANIVAVIIYLTCSYTILPLLLAAINGDVLMVFFLPNPEFGALNLAVVVEVILAVGLLIARWKRVTLPEEVAS
jgi:hypothetical protein